MIAGFGHELLERLPAEAIAGAPREQWGSSDPDAVAHWRERLGAFRGVVTWSPMIDPEWLKYISAELLLSAGVTILRGPRVRRNEERAEGTWDVTRTISEFLPAQWAGVDFERWLEFKRNEPSAYRALMEQTGQALGFVERPVIGWRNDVALFLGPRLSGFSRRPSCARSRSA